ncbi:hypothetical protein CH063_15367 [Colletotrichum higginsianum]|uniref:Uncharacterized protein n=1 Tax=Colletotrichum higginsianum (strain IMI 349063) TaxID=759273 RepID=H1W2H8_COLHI|nr:hypothetical protein CH063_15367 [Colletotrichum higginsianum]
MKRQQRLNPLAVAPHERQSSSKFHLSQKIGLRALAWVSAPKRRNAYDLLTSGTTVPHQDTDPIRVGKRRWASDKRANGSRCLQSGAR